MNCEDVRDAILLGRSLDEPAIARHLEECEVCASLSSGDALGPLLRDASAVPATPPPPRFGGALDRVRSLATPTRLLLLVSAVLLVGAVNALALPRPDLEAYPALRMILLVAAFAAAAVFASILVLRPVHRPRPDRRLLPALVAIGILVTIGAAFLPPAHAEVHAHPESFLGQGDDFWPRAIGCLVYGTIFGLPVLVLLRLLDRGGTPRSTALLGGLIATALAGNVALLLHCPLVFDLHFLVGHAGLPILLTLVGLALLLRPRREG